MNDEEITTLVSRLGRPHLSGGIVIERAAIQAAGADYPAVIDWIIDHDGRPEAVTAPVKSRGLHGSRVNDASQPSSRQPMRFVLPAGALD